MQNAVFTSGSLPESRKYLRETTKKSEHNFKAIWVLLSCDYFQTIVNPLITLGWHMLSSSLGSGTKFINVYNIRYLHRSHYQNLENTWRNHQEIWNQPRTPNAKCRSRLCSKRLFLGPKSFFPSYYPHHRNSNFLATNKPSGNDFYPNNWRVIIFLFWSLLLVFILLSFFFLSFCFGFWVLYQWV